MSANLSRDYTSSMHLGRLDQLVLRAAVFRLVRFDSEVDERRSSS